MSLRSKLVVLALLLSGAVHLMSAGAQEATGRVPASQIIKSTVRAFIVNCQVNEAPDGDPLGIPIFSTCQAISAGSGTIISQQGLILTNAHVALNRETQQPQWLLIAATTDARELPTPVFFARSKIYDAAVDLALAEPTYTLDGRPIEEGDVNLLPLPMNQTEQGVELEQPLRLIGYPMVGGNTITINPAVVSGFSPDQNAPELGGGAWIKTDPAGGAGISGGTAVNDDGILVGVPSAAGLAEIRCLDLDGDGDTDPASECAATAGETGLSRPIPEAYDLLLQKAEASGQLDNNGNGTDPTPTPGTDNPQPPDEGVIITGHIVSADTGDPIQGAYIYVFQPGVTVQEAVDNQNPADIYSYGQADGTGTYILIDPVVRDQKYSIIFQAPGYNSLGGDDIVLATATDPSTNDIGTVELPSAQ